MLQENDIEISLRCQQFKCKCYMRNEEKWSLSSFSRVEIKQSRCAAKNAEDEST